MSNQNELPWISRARGYIGLKENTSKSHHNQIILDMLDAMGSFNGEASPWWSDDETPWCGLFAGYIMGISGRYVVHEWYRAKEWNSDKMTKLDLPAYGCIVTFTRSGGGHVGFVVGKDTRGNLMVLGGNQKNMVRIDPFSMDRVTGFYWPSRPSGTGATKSVPHDYRYDLPVVESQSKLSRDEA